MKVEIGALERFGGEVAIWIGEDDPDWIGIDLFREDEVITRLVVEKGALTRALLMILGGIDREGEDHTSIVVRVQDTQS